MEFKPFSKKQLRVLCWWCEESADRDRDAIICDGAVRSGKTLCMSISFVSWAFYRFSDMDFAICGKTVTALKRNVVTPLTGILKALGFSCSLKASQNLLTIEKDGRRNRFYLFGGKDESSAALIQGITLAGLFLDEVALMPQSFVEQALARCSVTGSKFWFNCNPEHPGHWFYREWTKSAKEKNALYVHFTMEDNPSLSPSILRRYASLYTGTFYERFVLGKWVAAQGLVYPMFREEAYVKPPPQGPAEEYFISCDYGTVNPTSMGLWGRYGRSWWRIDEYYYWSKRDGGQKTDEEYYAALERLAGKLPVQAVICDPSAASFMTCIRRHGRFRVLPAKNDVADGIRRVSDALKGGRLYFAPGCGDILREFSLYRWDASSVKDVPVKENDHAMDDMRYFVSTALEEDSGFFAVAASRGG